MLDAKDERGNLLNFLNYIKMIFMKNIFKCSDFIKTKEKVRCIVCKIECLVTFHELCICYERIIKTAQCSTLAFAP